MTVLAAEMLLVGAAPAGAVTVDVVPPAPACSVAVADTPATSVPAAVSRNGNAAIFLERSASTGRYAIVRRDLVTHAAVRLSPEVAVPQDLVSASLSDDGSLLATSSADPTSSPPAFTQSVHDFAAGTSTTIAARGGALVALSGDGRTVAVAGGGHVSTYVVPTSTLTDIATVPADDARELRISQDGRYIAFASRDSALQPDTIHTTVYDRHAPVSLPATATVLQGVGHRLRMTADGLNLFSNDALESTAQVIAWQTATTTAFGAYRIDDVDSGGRYVLATRAGGSVRIDRSTNAVEPMNGPNGQIATILTADGGAALAAGFLVRPGLPMAAVTSSFPDRLSRGTTSRIHFFHADVVSATAVEAGDELVFDHPPVSDGGFLTFAPDNLDPVHHIAITGPSGCVGLLEVAVERGPYAAVAGGERILDTRPETAVGWSGPKPGPGQVVHVHAPLGPTGEANPPIYDAFLVNVTIDEATAPGFVTVYDCVTLPNVSSVNATPGSISANLAVVQPHGASDEFCVYTQSGAHLIVDFESAVTDPGPGGPSRLLDTRSESQTGYQGSKPGPGATVEVRLPDDMFSAVLNVTGVDATAPGFVTVYPCGTPRPTASNLNLEPGRISANLVVVTAGADHKVCIYTQSGAHLVVDKPLRGNFDLADVVTPQRVLDTRPESRIGFIGDKPSAQSVVQVPLPRSLVEAAFVRGAGEASAILTVTAVDADGPGYVTAFPCRTPMPTASNLNVAPGHISANLVVVPLGADLTVCLFTQSGSHLIADLAGVI